MLNNRKIFDNNRSKSGTISCRPSNSCQGRWEEGPKALPLPGNQEIAVMAWPHGDFGLLSTAARRMAADKALPHEAGRGLGLVKQ